MYPVLRMRPGIPMPAGVRRRSRLATSSRPLRAAVPALLTAPSCQTLPGDAARRGRRASMQESPAPVDVHRHCRLSAASRLPHPGPSSPGRILVWHACPAPRVAPRTTVPPLRTRALRSEEHTSELQPLLRIAYAVFCLKNKTILTVI